MTKRLGNELPDATMHALPSTSPEVPHAPGMAAGRCTSLVLTGWRCWVEDVIYKMCIYAALPPHDTSIMSWKLRATRQTRPGT